MFVGDAHARAGAYYWAGPGTIRMIKLKFFDAPVDEEQSLRAYDRDVLERMRDVLGLTDAWVTYSWGFSDATEAPDRAFLRGKTDHFRRLGIRTHAYVQGTNLVHAEHSERDYWCRDQGDRPIPYHRGRKLCCPLNPDFRALLLSRVDAACREDVDGVYVDNFHFGQFPLAIGGRATFMGCRCRHCAEAYRRAYGGTIPASHWLGSPATEEFLAFRSDAMHGLAAEIAAVAHGHGKSFGTNSFDLRLDPRLFYGVDPRVLAGRQDYLLVENFSHPGAGRSNAALRPLIASAGVPVFVTSYKRIIGRHPGFSQRDLDAVRGESAALGYHPCYKASEFTTRGRWHTLDPHAYRPVRPVAVRPVPVPERTPRAPRRLIFPGLLLAALNAAVPRILTPVYEVRAVRSLLGWIVDAATTRTWKSPLRRPMAC